MLKKGSKLNSILTGSCPRCQKESMYVDQNLLHVQNCITMNEACSNCGLKYQIEPSFFYGAMYVGYGLNVALGIAVFILSYLVFNSSIKTAFIAIIVAIIVFVPIVLRLSRNIYINMFVGFDKNLK
jgi:uncharacterized protein (DUF983 family)